MACPTAPPAGTCGAITACLCPLPPYKIGPRSGEKKAHGQMDGAFLDWALESFSGYVAADELYEGPYCVLSAVDNRRYKRILHIPPNLVVKRVTAHRNPPEVRIWRFRNQSCVGTLPPSTSTPHCPACWARRWEGTRLYRWASPVRNAGG